MPKRKNIYKYPVQFMPRSHGDLLKDDPFESKNVIIPIEPENWKYGVYNNDGYDYSQHLITSEDFNDETIDLPKIDYDRRVSMHPSLATKSATVINEIEINEEHCISELYMEKQFDNIAMEKLKSIAKKDLDEDLLFALNNAKCSDEFSDDDGLDDNFIELADGVPNTFNCRSGTIARFFDEDINSTMSNDDSSNSNCDDINFDGPFIKTLNDISQNDDSLCGTKKLKMSEGEVSFRSVMSLSMISILNRNRELKEAKKNVQLVNPVPEDMKKYIVYEDIEYNEEDADKAVDDWYNGGKKAPAIITTKKKITNKHIPKMMDVPKAPKNTQEIMVTYQNDHQQQSYEIVRHIHQPRKKDETTEEKKERKRDIKVAKRSNTENNKINRDNFTANKGAFKAKRNK